MALLSLSWRKLIALTILKTKKMIENAKNDNNAKLDREVELDVLLIMIFIPYIHLYNYIYSYNTNRLKYKLTKTVTYGIIGIIVIIYKKVILNIFKHILFTPNRLAL